LGWRYKAFAHSIWLSAPRSRPVQTSVRAERYVQNTDGVPRHRGWLARRDDV